MNKINQIPHLRALVTNLQEGEVSVNSLKLPKYNIEFFQSSLIQLVGKMGSGKTEIVLDFLKEQSQKNPNLQAAWVEESFSLHPPFLEVKDLSLATVLFCEAKEVNFWWTAYQLINASFSIVVLAPRTLDSLELRRLQLKVKQQANKMIFILSSEVDPNVSTWMIRQKFFVERTTDSKIEVKES